MLQMTGSLITVAIAIIAFVAVASRSKMRPARKALLLMVLFVVLFVALGNDCNESGGAEYNSDDLVKFGNDFADKVDKAAREAGIPNNLSGEISKEIFSWDWD